jgi:FixJ family two-component response regulator
MRACNPVVLVVDDDAGMRSALERVLTRAGCIVELYESGSDFLCRARFDRLGCVLLDIAMPGLSGLEVQAHLNSRSVTLPVLFLTGVADIPSAVATMRDGAVDFIEKPFDNDDLVARVRRAIDIHGEVSRDGAERLLVQQRWGTLTPREREILELVVAGRTNKEIGRLVGTSHRTIDVHRAHLMEKMAARNLADLVRMRLALDRALHDDRQG